MKPGNRVSWTVSSIRGRTLSMRIMEGVLVSIDGDTSIMKTKSRLKPVATSLLRLDGEKSDITNFIELMKGGL